VGDAIGFIGAGQMGEPMVQRLLAANHEVTVYARRGDVRERLANAGALHADSIADLAAHSDVLIACLFSDAQLREVAHGPDGLIANAKPGAVLVSHTTGSVATLGELAGLSPSGPMILDAPVSGTTDDIDAGNLTVLIGGASGAVDRVRPVIAAYANPIIATGELGSALNIKLVNNVLFAANAQLAATAVDLGRALGVQPDALLNALACCSGGSTAAMHMQGIGGVDVFETLAAPFLRKDFAAAVDAADDVGMDLGLLRKVVESGPLSLTVQSPSRP
jgi:3-hydroxyisobutyrate dehydrogenase-like beta-hydroxyacid dehydrogenase